MKINCYLLLYQLLKNKWCQNESNSTIAPHQDTKRSKVPKAACSAAEFRIHGRALHYSFKVGDRKRTIRFYREILGMKVLRHEEFTQGCETNTNGLYDDRWSKTMVGYGTEDEYFAFELTYNYAVHNYLKGNEFISVTIRSRDVIARAKAGNWPILDGNVLEAPGGFRFHILDEPQPTKEDPVVKVTLACSDYKKSLYYWHGVLGLILFERDNRKKCISVGFKSSEVKLEFQQIEQPLLLGDQSGRIYFSCPYYQQPQISDKIISKGFEIVLPLIPLETPGKTTVRMLILSDPDGHELCFVEDLAFRQLSQYSPQDEDHLNRCIAIEDERDYIIGEPAKTAEFLQIENSVKKAQIRHKNDAKKNVSISLPVFEAGNLISQKSDEEVQKMKLTVIVNKNELKESTKETTNTMDSKNQQKCWELQPRESSNSTITSSEKYSYSIIESLVNKAVSTKFAESVNNTISQSLEDTVSKVVCEKLNETVQNVVSEKIVETIAKAVRDIEESVKNTMALNLPIIQEEVNGMNGEMLKTYPISVPEPRNGEDRRPPKPGSKTYARRSLKTVKRSRDDEHHKN